MDDRRKRAEFLSNLCKAPPLTEEERALMKVMRGVVKKLSNAKRIAGTVNDSVEKFFDKTDDNAGWGRR